MKLKYKLAAELEAVLQGEDPDACIEALRIGTQEFYAKLIAEQVEEASVSVDLLVIAAQGNA